MWPEKLKPANTSPKEIFNHRDLHFIVVSFLISFISQFLDVHHPCQCQLINVSFDLKHHLMVGWWWLFES